MIAAGPHRRTGYSTKRRESPTNHPAATPRPLTLGLASRTGAAARAGAMSVLTSRCYPSAAPRTRAHGAGAKPLPSHRDMKSSVGDPGMSGGTVTSLRGRLGEVGRRLNSALQVLV